MPEMYDLV
ncbi:Protein of unknown function [Lactobacillus helveticus CIRM-BIA 951]|uniref:Uncharacterized protein n=1 Tax=Lactobacillus helveticus CIRM-BIA 951 TaxID=1226334 RepID=U6F149_LACHE|nr:Protein of unknown function [Lactobacillus helveticus CIRM-BIA 951]